jgi:hypothetical protein
MLVFLFILIPVLPLLKDETRPVKGWIEFIATSQGMCIVAACLVGMCWLGHQTIYLNYNLSRDEQMADFDAYIFAHGKLFWPLPKFWQIHALALNQNFMLDIGNHEAWISGYLPINAALRAITSFLVPSSFTSPGLVALGAISLWRIAKHLWPDSPSTPGVALILYAGSAQVIANGMTAYAISGHLALNLIWLDLFLLNRRWSHLGALVVGFLATGLHQPLFHPLFVLPFLEMLYLQRRWRVLAFYLTGYLVIGAFWFVWPQWISSHGLARIATLAPGTPNYFLRWVQAAQPMGLEAIWLTALNLLRFVTWQHLLLLPLLAVGVRTSWRQALFPRAIAKSFLLPVVVMLILLPYQGHGWGYRYVHGVIGNGCLLACYGWVTLEANGLSLRRALVLTTAATFLIVMPVRGAMIHHMVSSFAGVSRAIAQIPAHFAIVENNAAPFADDVVLNQPDLSNRPIRLMASELSASDIPDVCAHGSIAFVEAPALMPITNFFGTIQIPVSQHILDLMQVAKQARCDAVTAR